jgi:pyroglutamyl-peptidase
MSCKLLLTGFGPFLSVMDNPSEALARSSNKPHHVIDVSYQAARTFIERLDADSFDLLLLMGVHGRAKNLRIEITAHNRTDKRLDIDGFSPAKQLVRQEGPQSIRGTLWPKVKLKPFFESHPAQRSYDAGRYLCNFIYYEALHRFPEKKIGFLHVPLVKAIPLGQQQESLSHLIRSIEDSCGR